MKKINWTIILLSVITIIELLVTKRMDGALVLWFFYGCYKFFI